MPNQDSPDFSFLNESSDPGNRPPHEPPAPEAGKPEEPTAEETQVEDDAGGPAWMNQSDDSEAQDSGTRFAAALGGSAPSNSASLFSESSETAAGEETLPMEEEPDDEADASVTETWEESPNQDVEEESLAPENESDETESPVAKADPVAMAAAAATAAISTPGSVGPEKTATSTDAPAAEVPVKKPALKASGSKRGKKSAQDDSSFKSVLLVSYASAVTLVCLYLLYQSYAGKPHDLESLPDLKPPMKNDEIAYRLVPEGADLPPGHTLKLGDSRRYGNLKVTPLRVESEPLQFAHYTGDPQRQRDATDPVLKLWVRFENVSSDQTFAPLDRKLLLTRIVDPSEPEFLRSNQFLAARSDKGNLEETILLYDLEMHGNWNFAGLPEDLTLGPGESCEVYIPSSEIDLAELDDQIVWRIQFRKGYHPKSYRGVTTLIEVRFDPKAIKNA